MHNSRQKKLNFPGLPFTLQLCAILISLMYIVSTVKFHEIMYVRSYFFFQIYQFQTISLATGIFYWHYVETVDEKLALIN